MAKDWKEYERTIAKQLGQWFGCVFRRTPSSGAWGKQGQSRFSKNNGHSDSASDFHGDIVAPPESLFPFSVECKTYKTVNLYLALYGKSEVFEWWSQCAADARRVGKRPMMVFKENNKKPLMAIDLKTYRQLSSVIDNSDLRCMVLTYKTAKGSLRAIYVFHFESFINAVNARMIKKLVTE